MTTFIDTLRGGAGSVAYAFHVAGMPWVATSNESLGAYLKATDDSGYYFDFFADTARSIPFLPCLQIDATAISWRFDDAEGLRGGDWSVDLAEIHPGVDWSLLTTQNSYTYNLIGSSNLFGLPGVSQVFDARNDTNIAIGELVSDMTWDSTAIDVKDVRGLSKYLAAIEDDGAFLWIGHECVLIADYTDNSDGTYTLTLTNSDYRGRLRTRKQPHVINEYAARAEYVSSAPLGGIVGRPAQLWAFASSDNGATYGAPTLIAHGKVSQGISIKNGIASIAINNPFSWLDAPSPANDFSGQLRGFVFQRGDIGTAETQPYGPVEWGSSGLPKTQSRASHISFYERASDGADGYRDHYVSVWLCEKDSYAYYETIGDVCSAIQNELDKLYTGASGQMSGDDTSGNPAQELWYQYTVTPFGICRTDTTDDETDWWFVTVDEGGIHAIETISKVTGPVALCLGLVHATSTEPHVLEGSGGEVEFVNVENKNLERTAIQDRLAFPSAYPFSLGDRCAYLGGGAVGEYVTPPDTFWQFVPPFDLLYTHWLSSISSSLDNALIGDGFEAMLNTDAWTTRYYYEYGNDPQADPAYDIDAAYLGESAWCVPIGVGGHSSLFLSRQDGFLPVVDSIIHVGPANGDYAALYGTVSAVGEAGDYYYVRIDSQPDGISANCMLVPDGATKFAGMFNILSWTPCKMFPQDPWSISQGRVAEISSDASELIKGVLAISDDIVVSTRQSLYWVPEVGGDTCDGESWIDFDDLADKLQKTFADEQYTWRCSENGFLQTFTGLLKSHGLVPYLELRDTTNYSHYVVRFRQIGVVNVSDAYVYGQRIDDDIYSDRYGITRDVASGYIYSGIALKMNYDGSEFGVDIEIKDKSAFAQNGYGNKTYEIADTMTHSASLANIDVNKSVQAELSAKFVSGILPHISAPRPVSTAMCVCRAALLPVGGDVLVTDLYGRNPFTGAIGYTELPGIVTSVSLNLGNLKSRVSWRLARATSKGWAPALYCPASSLSYIGTSGGKYQYTVALTGSPKASTHEFSGSGEPQDAANFDCWDYDKVSGTYKARSCSCGDYAISIHEVDAAGAYIDGTCSVSGFDTGSLSMTILLDSTITTTNVHVIEYGLYDDAQPCQTARFVGFANDDGEIGDDDAPGDVWT